LLLLLLLLLFVFCCFSFICFYIFPFVSSHSVRSERKDDQIDQAGRQDACQGEEVSTARRRRVRGHV
jgi:hypothetical protein